MIALLYSAFLRLKEKSRELISCLLDIPKMWYAKLFFCDPLALLRGTEGVKDIVKSFGRVHLRGGINATWMVLLDVLWVKLLVQGF